MAKLAHEHGELAISRACAKNGVIQCVCNLHFLNIYAQVMFNCFGIDLHKCIISARRHRQRSTAWNTLLLPTIRQQRPISNRSSAQKSMGRKHTCLILNRRCAGAREEGSRRKSQDDRNDQDTYDWDTECQR